MNLRPAPRGQLWLLLGAARRRAVARRQRNRRVWSMRAGNPDAMDWGSLGTVLAVLLGVLLHTIFATVVLFATAAALHLDWPGAGLGRLASIFARGDHVADFVGSVALLWWSAALICQGEGPDLDTQRQRRPIWEWLFSMPVQPVTIFFAESLAPLAANPFLVSAPIFPAILYAGVYGRVWGAGALFLVGIPVTVAAAGLAKAIEIAIVLRTPPRVRGGLLGIVGWFGYVALPAPFLLIAVLKDASASLLSLLAWPASLPWPMAGWFIGRTGAGALDPWHGVLACWIGAGVTLTLAAGLARFAFARGLTGAADFRRVRDARPSTFRRAPLIRKELLWFWRDRSALVQAILVPLALATFRLPNIYLMVRRTAGSETSLVAGAAVLFGTFFLGVLGPRSLVSDGAALWIAETWPLGLEPMLRVKAQLWWGLASVIVLLAFGFETARQPGAAAALLLVFLGWLAFAHGMALRVVTLVAPVSASGETDRRPGQREAPFIGAFAFLSGVTTQRLSFVLLGVVLSQLMAAASWQGFRERLPLLADPWSQKLPPAPTLMHALVAIGTLIDLVGLAQIFVVIGFRGHPAPGWVAPAIYAGVAIAVAAVLWQFLEHRDVPMRKLWLWPGDAGRVWPLPLAAAAGAASGLALGTVGLAWTSALRIEGAKSSALSIPNHPPLALALAAILVAPWAEELLFRGLLFRALAREWHLPLAMAGSAALFAAYHPLPAWLPVGALGLVSAWLFRRSGQLAASVALHTVYNGVIFGAAFLR